MNPTSEEIAGGIFALLKPLLEQEEKTSEDKELIATLNTLWRCTGLGTEGRILAALDELPVKLRPQIKRRVSVPSEEDWRVSHYPSYVQMVGHFLSDCENHELAKKLGKPPPKRLDFGKREPLIDMGTEFEEITRMDPKDAIPAAVAHCQKYADKLVGHLRVGNEELESVFLELVFTLDDIVHYPDMDDFRSVRLALLAMMETCGLSKVLKIGLQEILYSANFDTPSCMLHDMWHYLPFLTEEQIIGLGKMLHRYAKHYWG